MAHKLIAKFDKGLNFHSNKAPAQPAAAARGHAAAAAQGTSPDAARIAEVAHRLVVKATRADPREIDWNAFAMIIDFVKYMSGGPGITQILKSFKRRWRSGNPVVQAKVLGGVDFCINCIGRAFSARLAGAELWRELKDASKYKNLVKPSVYELLMVYMQAWASNRRGGVVSLREFHAKLVKRGYKFPPDDSYDVVRPPRYIPLKQRTDDAVKVEMLTKAEMAIEDDDTLSVADLAEDAVIDESADDGIVVTCRVPSADLINLLDLDWDDDPVSSGQDPFAVSASDASTAGGQAAVAVNAVHAGHALVNPGAPAAPAADVAGTGSGAAASGNPFGEANAVFAAPVAGAIPTSAVPAPGEQKNPFGNPFTGGVGVQPQPGTAQAAGSFNPFGEGAPPLASVQQFAAPTAPAQNAWAVFGAAPPAAARAWGAAPAMPLPPNASFSVARNQQLLMAQQPGGAPSFSAPAGTHPSFSMPAGAAPSFSAPSGPPGGPGFPVAAATPVMVDPSVGSFAQRPPAQGIAPAQAPAQGNARVAQVLAGIPHPTQQKDPLASLLD